MSDGSGDESPAILLTLVPANYAIRVAFNNWLRCGAPIVSGVATSCGTAGAILAGSAGHPLTGYVEVADAIESARDSGLWALGPNARAVADAAISSSSTTLTSATANFSAADVGTGIYIAGAGASGAGLSTQIVSVTNSTTAVVFNAASTTVTGASLRLGALTGDGLHPTPQGHSILAPRITAFATSGLISYGYDLPKVANDNAAEKLAA